MKIECGLEIDISTVDTSSAGTNRLNPILKGKGYKFEFYRGCPLDPDIFIVLEPENLSVDSLIVLPLEEARERLVSVERCSCSKFGTNECPLSKSDGGENNE
ncbi:hypothetical protein HYS03_00180 [Candidatus Woesebacteria bacterium]|nr:hypothetical protein [Candidatus Woesebacteria bacterium]